MLPPHECGAKTQNHAVVMHLDEDDVRAVLDWDELIAAMDEALVEAWGPGAGWLAERAPALLGEEDDASGFVPRHPLLAELIADGKLKPQIAVEADGLTIVASGDYHDAADPTSLAEVGRRHVLLARGRDYADVRPLSGIYSGPAAEHLGVTVEVTRLG